MRQFFHGWRRKAGCVVLVLACALMGAWIRSLVVFDEINCSLGRESAVAMVSWKGAFALRFGWDKYDSWDEWVWHSREDDHYGYLDPASEFYRFEQPIPDGSGCFVTWYLHGENGGLGFSPVNQRDHCRMAFVILPYWSLVIPLTLLSAYLIFWKPRRRTTAMPLPRVVRS